MSARLNFFSLDLGTTKFCIARFDVERAKTGNRPLEVVSVPAAGMRRGMLSDFDKAKDVLQDLVSKAEKSFDYDIQRVVVGIAGSHLASEKAHVSLSLSDEGISEKDIQEIKRQAWTHFDAPERELLHCIPLQYQIDGRAPCDNPLGFTGQKLHGEFLYIHSDRSYLRDVIRICNQVGLQVDRLFSEPYASSVVIFNEDILRRGVAIADIGGGTTDGMVFQSGKADKCFTINIGGKLMTNDLAVGLNLQESEAEHKKRLIDLLSEENHLNNSQEWKILQSRIEELAHYFAKELKSYRGRLNAGLYLTGGGSQVKGLDKYLQFRLKVPVKIIPPCFSITGDDFTCVQNGANEYSTVLGLMKLELMHQSEALNENHKPGFRRYINSLLKWIKEMS